MKTLGHILITIGIFAISFDTIGSIGYGLYLWEGLGGGFAASVWSAFVVWMKVFAVSITLAVVGLALEEGYLEVD